MSLDLTGINKKVVKHVILIDSADRDTVSYTQGKYTIMLPLEYKQVCKVRLVTAEVPFSFYINSSAKLTSTFNIKIGANTQTCTIPDGSYTIYTLSDAITNAVAANATFKALSPAFTIVVSIDPATLKMTMTGTHQFSLDTTTTLTSTTLWGLAYNMGFVKNALHDSTQVDATTFTLTGTKPTNTIPNKYIILDINNLNFMDETQPVPLNNRSLAFGGNGTHKSAFAKIPVTGAPFDLILFDAGNSHYNEVIMNPVLGRLDRIQIGWHYHDGTIIDFNDMDHSLTLEIECLEHMM